MYNFLKNGDYSIPIRIEVHDQKLDCNSKRASVWIDRFGFDGIFPQIFLNYVQMSYQEQKLKKFDNTSDPIMYIQNI